MNRFDLRAALTGVVQGEADARELVVGDAEGEHAADLHALEAAVPVARYAYLLLHLCVDATIGIFQGY